ncbi:MAG TPA: hypothetical protein VFV33_21575 [Gemmatimonadaceae bacterium]|nr:hypothetical protein [Gemmatimonadaceae bacterium]
MIQIVARDDPNDLGADLIEWVKVDPCQRVAPMPEEIRPNGPFSKDERWYDWACATWGTKWGLYEIAKPVQLPGDTGAWQVVACSAWGPPNEQTRDLIAAALLNLGAQRVRWTGIDPYDDTFDDLGEWPAAGGGVCSP